MRIITGMVRSGTSAVCQILAELGLEFGNKSELMAPDRWNPRGYFENSKINTLNHRLMFAGFSDARHWLITDSERTWENRLRMLGAYALAPALVTESGIKRRGKKMTGAILALADGGGRQAAKDPRFCFTLAPWIDAGCIDSVLFCFRHPEAVAASLWRQERLPPVLSRMIWLAWNERFASASHRIPTTTVCYDALFDQQRQESQMQRLYNFAGRDFSSSQAKDLAAHCLDTQLRHRDDKLPVSSITRAAYQRLLLKSGIC